MRHFWRSLAWDLWGEELGIVLAVGVLVTAFLHAGARAFARWAVDL